MEDVFAAAEKAGLYNVCNDVLLNDVGQSLSIWTSITLNVLCLHAAPLQQADVCAFLADAVVHLTGRTVYSPHVSPKRRRAPLSTPANK